MVIKNISGVVVTPPVILLHVGILWLLAQAHFQPAPPDQPVMLLEAIGFESPAPESPQMRPQPPAQQPRQQTPQVTRQTPAPVQRAEPLLPAAQGELAAPVEQPPEPQPAAREEVAEPVAQAQAPATTPVPRREEAEVPPSFHASYLDNPKPAYPSISRELGEQGKVVLRVEVGADGRPSGAQVLRSSGFKRLDEAARKVVMRWKFVPAKRGDQAVAGVVQVPINFTLD